MERKDLQIDNVKENELLTVDEDGRISSTGMKKNEIASQKSLEDLADRVTAIEDGTIDIYNRVVALNGEEITE